MKKLIYILVLCLLLLSTSCSGKNDMDAGNTGKNDITESSTNEVENENEKSTDEAASQDTNSEEGGKVSLEGFDEIIVDESINPEELLKYIRENIAKASEDEASKLAMRLEAIQKNNLEALNNKFFEGEALQNEFLKLYPNGSVPGKNDTVENPELKSLLDETHNNGYKVDTAEAAYFPVIDYSIYNKFGSYLPDDISKYYSLMAVESDKAPAKDGALAIAWQEAVNRALALEEFILTYSDSQKYEEMQEVYNKYVTFIFGMLPNTPGFAHDTKIIDSGLKEALLKVAEKDGSTTLEKSIGEYVDVLEKNDYKLTREVEQFQESILP